MRLRIAAFGMVLFSVFLLGWMASDIPFSLPYSNVDFYTYYAGGKLFSQQQNIYSSELTNALLTAQELPYIQNSDYIYPPYMALLLSFVAGIPPRVLAFVWGILNLAGLALSVYWLADLSPIYSHVFANSLNFCCWRCASCLHNMRCLWGR